MVWAFVAIQVEKYIQPFLIFSIVAGGPQNLRGLRQM